jgi:4-hydroxybenzoate polyprenyltransferase
MEGDQKTHVKSIAIVSGKNIARRWAIATQFHIIPLTVASYFLINTDGFGVSEITYYTSISIGIVALLSIFLGIKETWVSLLLKVSMIIGTLTFFTL